VIAVLVVTVASGEMIANSQAGRRQLITERFNNRHTTATRFVEAYVEQILIRQRQLGDSVLQRAISVDRFDEIAKQNLFSSAILLDADGQLLAVSPPDSKKLGTPVGRRYAYLRLALGGIPTVSDVVTSTSRREPLIDFAVPFRAGTGLRVLSSGYAISDTPLQPFLVGALSTFRTAKVYLVDSGGTVIASDVPDSVGTLLERSAPALVDSMREQPTGAIGSGERRQHYVSGSVKGTGWRLVFVLDTAELYETFPAAQVRTPWAALFGFLLMALVMIGLFTRALAGRVQAEGEHARQEAILDTAADAFIGMDATGLITEWNIAASRLLGWARAEAIGQPVARLMIPPRDRDRHTAGLRQFLDTGITCLPQHPIMVTAQHRDGHFIPVELTVSRSQWQGTWRFHGFMRDITERLEHENQLSDLALTDSLTGLANRRAFLDRLDQAHARSRRHRTRLAVLYADVDQFKGINDTYGHAAGDAILRDVGDRLRALFRTEDTIGRLGGDEFAIVCEDFDNSFDDLRDRVRQALAVPYLFRGQPILATVSVGVAIPSISETAAQLLERADSLMYEAKAAHRT
jgi:diguanylate cyclase (GGDEF)-like protein/PAS domain S-box-containing protein